jgi:hypothetical protein
MSKSMVIAAILEHIDNALQVDGAELKHEGMHVLILHSLGSSTGLYSSILNDIGGLLGNLLVLGLFNVSNLYRLAICINSYILTCYFDSKLINNNLWTL